MRLAGFGFDFNINKLGIRIENGEKNSISNFKLNLLDLEDDELIKLDLSTTGPALAKAFFFNRFFSFLVKRRSPMIFQQCINNRKSSNECWIGFLVIFFCKIN